MVDKFVLGADKVDDASARLVTFTQLFKYFIEQNRKKSDIDVLNTLFINADPALVSLLSDVQDAGSLDILADCCLGILQESGISPIVSAVTQADELVEASPQQQSFVLTAVLVGGAFTAIGTAFAVAVILASRIAGINLKTGEFSFYEGVPKEVVKVITEIQAGNIKSSNIIDRLTDLQ
jgi:hypothetical protein